MNRKQPNRTRHAPQARTIARRQVAADRAAEVASRHYLDGGSYTCCWCGTTFLPGSFGWGHEAPLGVEEVLCPGCNHDPGLKCPDCGDSLSCKECRVGAQILATTGRPGFYSSRSAS